MKIHEYQAKQIFSEHGIPVPRGSTASNAEEATQIARRTSASRWVVKAQILAGGRGKAGGVRMADSPRAVGKAAKEMLGTTLVTTQTGPKGRRVSKVLVEEGLRIKQEFYVGATIDRANQCPVLIVGLEGGTDVEESAALRPDRIVRELIDVKVGLPSALAQDLASCMGLDAGVLDNCADLLIKIYNLFVSLDCTMVEINPLVATAERQLVALDAKMEFDDNALFRHEPLIDLQDTSDLDPLELEASRHRLNYIRMDGDLAIMVNGAGLAMATMDLVKQAGARPANFLDVGGGATMEMVTKAFEIILQDKNVRGILINIFGGILRCDVLARGIVEASKSVAVRVPVVVRLDGTNVEQGRAILAGSGLDFQVAHSMADAALKVKLLAQK